MKMWHEVRRLGEGGSIQIKNLALRAVLNSGLPNASPCKGTQALVAILRLLCGWVLKEHMTDRFAFAYGSSVYIVPFPLRGRAQPP